MNNKKFQCILLFNRAVSRSFLFLRKKKTKVPSNKFFFILLLGCIEYFRTHRGNKGLRIEDYTYKRHYETSNSVYWICTLSNKLKCKQRVIAGKGKPFHIRFKGPGHNHDIKDYQQSFVKVSSGMKVVETVGQEFSDME